MKIRRKNSLRRCYILVLAALAFSAIIDNVHAQQYECGPSYTTPFDKSSFEKSASERAGRCDYATRSKNWAGTIENEVPTGVVKQIVDIWQELRVQKEELRKKLSPLDYHDIADRNRYCENQENKRTCLRMLRTEFLKMHESAINLLKGLVEECKVSVNIRALGRCAGKPRIEAKPYCQEAISSRSNQSKIRGLRGLFNSGKWRSFEDRVEELLEFAGQTLIARSEALKAELESTGVCDPKCNNNAADKGEECDPTTAWKGPSGYECTNDCKLKKKDRCNQPLVAALHIRTLGWDGDPNGFESEEEECPLPECGNGDLEPGEECDDGNTMSQDGCDANCRIESTAPICGNGSIDFGELCDDGNSDSLDGCTADCNIEVCGDGIINNSGQEKCDDGNSYSGDGCAADCTPEFCGDGILNNLFTEICDDGNAIDGDGCNVDCTMTAGICGNGNLEYGEGCDDSNTGDGDGCSATCSLE